MCVGAGLLLLGATACGSDRDDAVEGTTLPTDTVVVETYPASGATDSVVAIDNNFLPQTLTVVAGTEVVFTNNGRNAHNLVPADDPEATTWGVLETGFQPKSTYSRVFTTPGTYIYYCTIHGSPKAGMVGTIVVTAP